MIKDRYVQLLKRLDATKPDNRDEINDILRDFHQNNRLLGTIEYYGASILMYEKPMYAYITRLITRIYDEINLGVNPPLGTYVSQRYYSYHSGIDVIFAPLCESEFLLHLPDIYHEIGHAVLEKLDEPALHEMKDSINGIVMEINRYYDRRIRMSHPKDEDYYKGLAQNWRTKWVREYLSDLFAIYTLGPAYAYSHIHLCTKRYIQIDVFDVHPSDDSRMKLMLDGLRNMGFNGDVQKIIRLWDNIPFEKSARSTSDFYNDRLLQAISEKFYFGLKHSGIRIVEPDMLNGTDDGSVRRIINDSWHSFLSKPIERYYEDEKDYMGRIKGIK